MTHIDINTDVNGYAVTYRIGGLLFVGTCSACPEQYDVYDNTFKQVGYIRLRFGHLRCDYPDCGGDTIYYHMFYDDWQGEFDSEEDRLMHLNLIAEKINEQKEKV